MKFLISILIALMPLVSSASFYIPDGSISPKKLAPLAIGRNGPTPPTDNLNVVVTSTSYVDLLKYSVTIVRTGRPVWVGLVRNYNSAGIGEITIGGGSAPEGNIQFLSGATVIDQQGMNSAGTSGLFTSIPCSSFHTIDSTTTKGSVTYKAQGKVTSGVTMTLYSCSLIAYEL